MNKLQRYTNRIENLNKQIDLCHSYKQEIKEILKELYGQYKAGLIDKATYDSKTSKFLENKTPKDWYSMYDNYIENYQNEIEQYGNEIENIQLDQNQKINSSSKIFMFIGIISLVLSALFFLQPTITGLTSYSEPLEIFEDGYEKEGSQWTQIQGSRLYERCLQVNSKIKFNSVNIRAKITSATETKELSLRLYFNNETTNEPLELINSCKVEDYTNIWKSCSINKLEQNPDSYWICASNPSGNSDQEYYIIAYQNGGSKRTALWTGQNWQKLNRSSYTIKAKFINNE